MKIPKKIKQLFSSAQEENAEALINSVFLSLAGDEAVDAEIGDFFVELNLQNDHLKCHCSCPQFTEKKPCLHILAVILKARSLSFLKVINKRSFKGFSNIDQSALAPTETNKKESIQQLLQKVNKTHSDRRQTHNNTPKEAPKAFISNEPLPIIIVEPDNHNRQNLCLSCCWNQAGQLQPFFLDQSQSSSELKNILLSLPRGEKESSFILSTPGQMKLLKELQKYSKFVSRNDEGALLDIHEVANNWNFAPIIGRDYENNFTIDFALANGQQEALIPLWKNGLCAFIEPHQLVIMPTIKGNMIALLRRDRMVYPFFESGQLLQDLHENACDLSKLPDGLACTETAADSPHLKIHIRTAKFKYQGREQLHADPYFLYQGSEIHADCEDETILNSATKSFMERDKSFEKKTIKELEDLPFRYNKNTRLEEVGYKLAPSALDETVQKLLALSWTVTAHGKTQHGPSDKELNIEGKTDWFEVKGSMTFNGEKISLPEILKAVQSGEKHVLLGDGSFGVLPEDWLKFYTVLSEIGETKDGEVILRPSQTLIIRELLKFRGRAQDFGKDFQETLEHFDLLKDITPVRELPAFKGELRPYQREGLAWLLSLRKAGFGGCLADDMGLGKTIQILAFLQYIIKKDSNPVLIVLPRSLMFNWQQEAAKFTPEFKVFLHTGSKRQKDCANFSDYDIVLTTYGTLLRDIPVMSKISFNACILDEAQAIKNATSSISGAVRLLRAKQHIAMSGTPIENHIGELGSLFDFLNPGMLGSGNLSASLKSLPKTTFPMLAQAFQPLILRRHKSDLLKELPPKVEQVIYCEMDKEQQKTYDELKNFYQGQMVQKDEGKGERLTDALTALLRLRQAACHPAVIDPEYAHKSVKMEMLLSRINELKEEGRKCLVFSQFTKLLDLAEERLQEDNITYCRLDGSTKDRAAVVNEFQDNSNISTFLISLKAGGTGLNLTKADTVFMLDPWWNPAAENQAIDRAWRMGQKNTVFAYRLITKGTVEEKVMALQKSKKEVADAILAGDFQEANNKLSFEELQNLLG